MGVEADADVSGPVGSVGIYLGGKGRGRRGCVCGLVRGKDETQLVTVVCISTTIEPELPPSRPRLPDPILALPSLPPPQPPSFSSPYRYGRLSTSRRTTTSVPLLRLPSAVFYLDMTSNVLLIVSTRVF